MSRKKTLWSYFSYFKKKVSGNANWTKCYECGLEIVLVKRGLEMFFSEMGLTYGKLRSSLEAWKMPFLFRQLNHSSFNIDLYNWILTHFLKLFYMLILVITVLKCQKRFNSYL